MAEVTHEQAHLMLRLYEMRREPRLRQARQWFISSFQAVPPEEFMQKYPMGTEENASIRMVTSYWEMCAGLVNRGLMDDELFFENNGEAWVTWEKIKPTAPAWRAAMKNPRAFAHLEALAKRMDEWRERVAPGSTEMLRQRFAAMAQSSARA